MRATEDLTAGGRDVDDRRQTGEAGFPLSKRLMDVIVAASLLLLVAPVLVLLAAVVRRDGGPAIFTQARVGAGGIPFQMRKLRSMVVDAQDRLMADPHLYELWESNGFKLPESADPRITEVGRFLRSTSLDELPQLINVLKGEMSMVGPRPIEPVELINYERHGAVDVYCSARPGLTGLWQVSGRSSVSYDERIALDRKYLVERSLGFDLIILFRTAIAVLRRVGAH